MARIALFGTLLAWCLAGAAPTPRAETAGLRLLYVPDAAPFSELENGHPEGYAITLCTAIAAALRPGATPVWQPAAIAAGIDRIARGEADLLCGPVTDTVARESQVAFSSPVAIGGIGALLRPGAPPWLRHLLGMDAATVPPRELLDTLNWPTRIAVVRAGTAADWLQRRLAEAPFGVSAHPVADYQEAGRLLAAGTVGAWIGEWTVLAHRRLADPSLAAMTLAPEPIEGEPIALAMRPDPALRRAVQAALSRILRGPDLPALMGRWFGPAGRSQADMIRAVTPPAGTP
ncbi:MAG TPA: transporter substrate-binding domain-containing protein [Acetobacteraceae bacterium]|nr:transporter substrate-binding domain-containing protein [Acetobacteraceae bacterium]